MKNVRYIKTKPEKALYLRQAFTLAGMKRKAIPQTWELICWLDIHLFTHKSWVSSQYHNMFYSFYNWMFLLNSSVWGVGWWCGGSGVQRWGYLMCTTAVKLLDVRYKFDPTGERDYFHPSCLDVHQRNESLAVCQQRWCHFSERNQCKTSFPFKLSTVGFLSHERFNGRFLN